MNTEGSVFRPLFEGPEVYFPRGAKLNEHNKWTGLCVFSKENEECVNMTETEDHSRKVGFCRKSLLNVEVDIGNATATPKDGDVEIYKTADSVMLFLLFFAKEKV